MIRTLNVCACNENSQTITKTFEKYLPCLQIVLQRPVVLKHAETARELLQQVAIPKPGVAILIVYEGKMSSDKKGSSSIAGFVPKQGYQIEGLAEKDNRRAIISCVSSKALRHTAIHETGHLLGLPHCQSPQCFMTDGLKVRGGYSFEWCQACASLLAHHQSSGS